ncbi:MAG: class I SAM-dependent methyltransferase [Patescibacteria group bacterium]
MKERLSKFYQHFHERQEKYGFVHHLSAKIRYFQAQIGKNKKILDLGCRDGTMAKVFAAGNDLTGVDIDPKACELCRHNLGIKVIWHDLNEPLPFADASYDIVVLSDVLEHVFLTEPLLTEIYRVLKPGGLFLGSTPNAYYWSNRWHMAKGQDLIEYIDATHVRHFSLASLKGLLHNHFDSVAVIPYGQHIFSQYWPTMFAGDFFWKSIKKKGG